MKKNWITSTHEDSGHTVLRDEKRRIIANFQINNDDNACNELSQEEIDENANLAKAAPDMLEALDMVQRWFYFTYHGQGTQDYLDIDMIEAAIKKSNP